jgi:hypothetical protein
LPAGHTINAATAEAVIDGGQLQVSFTDKAGASTQINSDQPSPAFGLGAAGGDGAEGSVTEGIDGRSGGTEGGCEGRGGEDLEDGEVQVRGADGQWRNVGGQVPSASKKAAALTTVPTAAAFTAPAAFTPHMARPAAATAATAFPAAPAAAGAAPAAYAQAFQPLIPVAQCEQEVVLIDTDHEEEGQAVSGADSRR